jgi:regulator of protease activity HflC (stomatin/prohibitin superfamily)
MESFDFPIGFSIFFVAAVVLIIAFVAKAFYLVRQAEAVIIERFGRFDRILTPGIHFVMPVIEATRKLVWTTVRQEDSRYYYRETRVMDRIDLRETVYDFPKQNVITKDNVTMEINALLYFQITDPKACVYEVVNLPEAIEKLAQTTLRNVIGHMDLDESLVSRDRINEKLRIILDEAADKWGVKVNRVELQEVNPPVDIRHAMEKQMRAERDRRAIILEAEGQKSSAILAAEGEKLSNVLRAQGIAEAKIIAAESEAAARLKIQEAEAQAIVMVKNAVGSHDPLPYLIAQQYIKAMPEMFKDKEGKLILVPYEASSLMGSLASMKKLFEEVKN